MLKTDFLLLMDELFEFDDGTIQGGDELNQIRGWSSLTFIGLIAMVDEECGIALAPKSIMACRTVDDLIGLLGDAIEPPAAAA